MPITFALKSTVAGITSLSVVLGCGLAVDDRYTSADELKSSQAVQNHLIVGQLRDFRIKYTDDRIKQLGADIEHIRFKKATAPNAVTELDLWREQSIMDDIRQLQREKKDLQDAKQKAIDTLNDFGE